MTVKPLPRNFIKVRDLVGDSTITRVLPVASTALAEEARPVLVRGRAALAWPAATSAPFAGLDGIAPGFFAPRFRVVAPALSGAFAAGAFAPGAFFAGFFRFLVDEVEVAMHDFSAVR
jgi:hypothetical protein